MSAPLHDENAQADAAVLRLLEGQIVQALAAIRDGHLYRGTHPRFEDYVRERFGKPESEVVP